jgi:hypothetical protein
MANEILSGKETLLVKGYSRHFCLLGGLLTLAREGDAEQGSCDREIFGPCNSEPWEQSEFSSLNMYAASTKKN